MTPIRVLLADDQTMFRDAVSALLSLEADIDVVAAVGRGDAVAAAVATHRPDVALLDIEMPGADGLTAARQLRAAGFAGAIAILTTFDRPGYLRAAMEAGANGYLLKDVPVSELAAAIRRVAAGARVVDPVLAAAALSEGASPLTQREAEVLMAARGHGTVAEIAAQLHLSPGTVRNHLSAAIRKLGARTRTEALALAERKGWV
jgi:two-component system response regulator DesR